MMSVDSGVETGNDSNDSSILLEKKRFDFDPELRILVNQARRMARDLERLDKPPRRYLVNQRKTKGKVPIDMDNIKWPTQIELDWNKNLQLENYNYDNYENKGNSLKDMLLSPNAGNLLLPRSCSHETGQNCSQLKQYSTYELNNSSPYEITKNESAKNAVICKWLKSRSHLRNKLKKQYVLIDNYRKSFAQRRMRMAAATNNIDLMAELLRNGELPNDFDDQGRTALHHAACRGYTEMVHLLLENGANPNQCDCVGNTPLHLAALTGKISVVTLLLQAGTNVHQSDKYGYNPLQLALTRLKLFQKYKDEDMSKVKEEMRHVVDMLMVYFQKQEKDNQNEMEMLSDFCSRLSLSNTSDQVQSDIKDLLTNINALSIIS